MNFNRGLVNNLPIVKTTSTTKATVTNMPTATPAAVTAAQKRSGTNVKTTTKTKMALVPHPLRPEVTLFPAVEKHNINNHNSLLPPTPKAAIARSPYTSSWSACSSLAINCWSSSIMPHKNKKTMQQQEQLKKNSKGMYDARARVTAEVMLPLTSMSAQQISLTSRVNIMDIEVANNETRKTSTATATETATYSTTKVDTRKATPVSVATTSLSATEPSLTLSSSSPSLSLPSPASSQNCCEGRMFCPSIKMPLRRLILTIMAAVVLSMEFTICSSSALEGRLTTLLLPSNNASARHTPAETLNTTSKNNDSPTNIPVAITTIHTTALPKSELPQHHLTVSPLVFASPMEIKSMKSLETASLIESSSPTVSPLTASSAVDTMESSQFFLTSLTDTTMMHSDPSQFDDVNASSELLSYPTSVLKTFDGSDLPPLTEAEQAAKDLLTKGFSIPTYLPPFPVFAVADLPAYLNTVSTTTTEPPPGDINSHENLLYFDNLGDHHQHQQHQHRKLQIPRRNGSLVGANNVTVQEGNHAYLPCRIHRLQNKPVSWVRMRDGHIISVDQTTFIADQRFQAIFQDDKEYTWSLQVKYVQPIDEGWYECQASSEPKMSARVYLKVVVPFTELIGDQSRFVKAGSKVALHCIVRGTLEPPQYIIWYRDKTQISEDNKMGWYTQLDRNIFGHNGDNENTIGSLIIPFVRKMDSGNYTCQPSNSATVSVDLHVLSGEYSASAIMSAARTTYNLNDSYLLALLLLLMSLHTT